LKADAGRHAPADCFWHEARALDAVCLGWGICV
jgi:hypothetical protein